MEQRSRSEGKKGRGGGEEEDSARYSGGMGRKKGMGDKPRVLILAPLNHFAAAFKLANRPMLIDRSSDAHHLLIVEMNDGSAAAAMQAECDRRCRLVELDSSSSSSGAVAFENAQWALSVLRHFHNQERFVSSIWVPVRLLSPVLPSVIQIILCWELSFFAFGYDFRVESCGEVF